MTYPRAPLSAAEELEITPPRFSRTSRVCVTQSALASKRVVVRYETMPMDNRTTSARLNPTPIILRGFIFALSGRRPAVLCYGSELPTRAPRSVPPAESERPIFYPRTKFRKTSAQVILFGERIRSQNFGAHGPISYHPTMAQDMGDRIHTEVKDFILALDIAQRHEGPRLYGARHPQSWSSGSRHSPPAKALHSGNPDAQGARGSRRR